MPCMSSPIVLRRSPAPALQPFVEELWASTAKGDAQAAVADPSPWAPVPLERVLPTGAMHIVLRLSDTPVRVLRAPGSNDWQTLKHGIVGGARSTFYVRAPGNASNSVGAVLRPGAAPSLFGVGADELAQRHTPLADLLGAQSAYLRDRLAEAGCPSTRLLILESFLAARLPLVRGMDPSVAQWLHATQPSKSIAVAVRASGLSHRQFIANFRRAFGLSPKAYQCVRRFQRVLRALHAAPAASLADLALQAGYSDQSHFNREFLAMTGVTPGEYRRNTPTQINHLPIDSPAHVAGQLHSRRTDLAAPH